MNASGVCVEREKPAARQSRMFSGSSSKNKTLARSVTAGEARLHSRSSMSGLPFGTAMPSTTSGRPRLLLLTEHEANTGSANLQVVSSRVRMAVSYVTMSSGRKPPGTMCCRYAPMTSALP